jgi:hypothetical protein
VCNVKLANYTCIDERGIRSIHIDATFKSFSVPVFEGNDDISHFIFHFSIEKSKKPTYSTHNNILNCFLFLVFDLPYRLDYFKVERNALRQEAISGLNCKYGHFDSILK